MAGISFAALDSPGGASHNGEEIKPSQLMMIPPHMGFWERYTVIIPRVMGLAAALGFVMWTLVCVLLAFHTGLPGTVVVLVPALLIGPLGAAVAILEYRSG